MAVRTGSRTVAILADFDAGTRVPGASGNTAAWRRMLPGVDQWALERQHGQHLPELLHSAVSDVLGQGKVPLTLGGDHSLTYWAVKAIYEHKGPLTVLHLDAHHDAYRSHLLNHYTFMHHLQRRFEVTVEAVGYRHDGSAPVRLNRCIHGPTYISLDVDYFSPEMVPEVVHPVWSPRPLPTLDDLDASLDRLRGPVVGADIVEWMSAGATTESTAVVKAALDAVLRTIAS